MEDWVVDTMRVETVALVDRIDVGDGDGGRISHYSSGDFSGSGLFYIISSAL